MFFLVAFCPWICLDGHFQLEGGEDGCGLAWQFFQDKCPGMRGRGWKHTPTPHVPWRPTVPSVFFVEENKYPNIRNYQHYQLFWGSLILKDSQVCMLEFFLFRTSFRRDASSDISYISDKSQTCILLPQDTTKSHLIIAENRHQAIDLQIFRLPSRWKDGSHKPNNGTNPMIISSLWMELSSLLYHIIPFCFVFLLMCWNSTATSLRDPKICWTRSTHSREAPMSCCKTLRCPRISAGATRMASDPTESVI